MPLTAYVAGTEPIAVWYGKFGVEGSADRFPIEILLLMLILKTEKSMPLFNLEVPVIIN